MRQSGPARFIQIHLELDDNLSLVPAHSIASCTVSDSSVVSRGIIIVHQDPCSVVLAERQGNFKRYFFIRKLAPPDHFCVICRHLVLPESIQLDASDKLPLSGQGRGLLVEASGNKINFAFKVQR